MRILLVEGEPTVARWTERILVEAGYAVERAGDGDDGLRVGCAGGFDLALVDIQLLPLRNGVSVVSVVSGLRKAGQTMPIVIMTGRAGDEDIVRGLDAGADDYIVKPVSADVLKARVRAALRRGGALRSEQLVFGALVLDRLARRVSANAATIELTPREFSLLEHFMLRPEEVVSRSELLDRVWGLNLDPGSNVIDATMNRLRSKLQEAVMSPTLRTVRGMGFVLTADVMHG